MALDNVDIINSLRKHTSLDYQNRIPILSRDNLANYADSILSVTPNRNEFLGALINRIGMDVVNTVLWENPLKEFKRGKLEFGDTIAETFTNIGQGRRYDRNEDANVQFINSAPDVQSAYYQVNVEHVYPYSVLQNDLRKAFTSSFGLQSLLDSFVNAMQGGAEQDEFLMTKNLITEYEKDSNFYKVQVPGVSNEDDTKNTLAIIRDYTSRATFNNTRFNAAGATNFLPLDKAVLLVNTTTNANLDVQALAYMFNIGVGDVRTRRVVLDSFGDLDNVAAILLDSRWFMIWDFMRELTDNFNPSTLRTNYFLHVQQLFAISPFFTAIAFITNSGGSSGVTNVAITGANSVPVNTQSNYTANVTVTGNAGQGVTWSITGNTSPSTSINQQGVLSVAANESATTISITAISNFDSSKKAAKNITITSP